MITKLAVKWLTRKLRRDEGFYVSYHANIAMAFQDEYERAMEKMKTGIEPFDIHTVANRAADNFMCLWTKA